MDWFLYDIGLRHKMVQFFSMVLFGLLLDCHSVLRILVSIVSEFENYSESQKLPPEVFCKKRCS